MKIPSKTLFFWGAQLYKELPEDFKIVREFAQELGDDKLFRKIMDCFAWENEQFVLKYIPIVNNGKKFGKTLKKIMDNYPQSKTIQAIKAGLDGMKESLKEFEE